jgi:hypothetical protein
MLNRRSYLLGVGALIGAGLLLAGFSLPRTAAEVRLNALDIPNQPMGGNQTVRVAEVFSQTPGWLVLHADQGHRTGAIVGWTHVNAGENLGVQVRLRLPDTLNATGLYAVLHADRGSLGRFEYPGPDEPVKTPAGRLAIDRFQLSWMPE